MTIADGYSQNIGQRLSDSPTSETAVDGTTEPIAHFPTTSAELTLSAEDSPVRTFLSATQQEKLSDSTENVAACGLNISESFADYDQDSSLWRTHQHSFFEGLEQFSETWPRAGMTRSGSAFLLPPLVPHISATGFGYLPTPDASLALIFGSYQSDVLSCFRKEETGYRPSGAKIGSSLRWSPEFIREWLRTGGELNPEWLEVLMGYAAGWTDAEDVETPLSRKLPSGLGDES